MKNKRAKVLGGLHLSDEDIDKLRNISSVCEKNIEMQNYITDVCHNINNLIIEYCNANHLDLQREKERRLHKDDVGMAGQVQASDIDNVINTGNIRERMTLIINFSFTSCDIMLWAIMINSDLISEYYKKLQNKRIKKISGLKPQELFEILCLSSDKQDPTCKMACALVNPHREGPVTIARLDNVAPYNIPVRNRRNPYKSMNFDAIASTLSKREISYILSKNPGKQFESNMIQWKSGHMVYDIGDENMKNYYNVIGNNFGQMLVSGPSGFTDVMMSTFMMFDNFNIELAILSLIVWMCYLPDHSPFEILLASLPFGLKDWSVKQDAFSFVYQLNDKYSSSLKRAASHRFSPHQTASTSNKKKTSPSQSANLTSKMPSPRRV